MSSSVPDRAEDACEQLRRTLASETRRCLEVQKKLDRANAEFEEFVSIAVHNLRESLRDVAAFSQLMAETHAGSLHSDAGACLERIRAGASGAQSLLADIVSYWSTHTVDRLTARTEMEAALCQALLATDEQITERQAIVTHDPLPRVCGDFELLAKVLHHLIRNAIQYCATPPPRVHISCRRMDADWLFSVADNGPGIEPEFQDRIFEVFKRLHGKEHPGNGLGLAFCKKAIEGHGGRIWMESTPGAGSTFYFTLRAAG